MAFYNVLSRPLMQRSSALGFLTVGMGAGAVVLVLAGLAKGSFAALEHFTAAQWIAACWSIRPPAGADQEQRGQRREAERG
ncbi:hypothetical protein N2605_19255 [Bradyrhizobium yuanmingense]|uniref:hypothetical protein n=1 Tax=Bradyrhizobium yuanmingense TaxID=108015 RepID=UPI0021A5962A|nr:hypothetical protein [Bradyrhizobium sp. CB1024]UWU81766.1 hypothetical protein N2605_19255 [Bradyrhizobium sp. CB1024]